MMTYHCDNDRRLVPVGIRIAKCNISYGLEVMQVVERNVSGVTGE